VINTSNLYETNSKEREIIRKYRCKIFCRSWMILSMSLKLTSRMLKRMISSIRKIKDASSKKQLLRRAILRMRRKNLKSKLMAS
jgi:hypothetical protein